MSSKRKLSTNNVNNNAKKKRKIDINNNNNNNNNTKMVCCICLCEMSQKCYSMATMINIELNYNQFIKNMIINNQ